MKCPQCQHDNRPAAKFCEDCGTPFRLQDQGVPPAASYADLQRALSEALDQQAATAEILRVISSSPTDIQSVLATVAERAARLCDSFDAAMFLVDGYALRRVAHHGPIPPTGSTTPLVRGFVNGRVVLERREIHLADLQAEVDEFPEGSAEAQRLGWRTTLAVPLMRENTVIGTIAIRRTEVRPFSMQQIDLLKTFADQAVIAIENVRLFKELEARNRDLTATGKILQVISRSPTDAQPVFDTIADNAVRLFRPWSAAVYRFDGEFMHVAAVRGGRPGSEQYLREQGGRHPTRDVMAGRCVIDRSVIHVPDFERDPGVPTAAREIARVRGFRATINVPMLRSGEPIGVISISRAEPGAFSQTEIDLLQTFADQAVIAIENVRLFKELESKNRDLTTALEQQTATSEILRVISSSPTDVAPVFQTILSSTNRLCEASFAVLWLWDGEALVPAAHASVSPGLAERLRTSRARPRRGGSPVALTALEQAVIHVPDVLDDPRFSPADVPSYQLEGARSILAVPMLREGSLVGVINTWRRDPRAFTDKQVALLKTFADQAVIAIENVRLFTELRERNADLSDALARETATSEILRVISRSPMDGKPVFDAIARNAVALCGGIAALVLRFDGKMLHVAGHHALSPEGVERNEQAYPRRPGRDYPPGRALLDRSVVHVPDLQAAIEFGASTARQRGAGSQLAVPLLRGGEAIGVIGLARDAVGPFSPQQIEVLQTFADQAVIAIENVRLFTELQEKNEALTGAHAQVSEALEQQTATSEILRVISQSPTDIQPVFDTIVRNAVRLCGAVYGTAYRIDRDVIDLVAHMDLSGAGWERFRMTFPRPLRDGGVLREVFESRRLLYLPDVDEYPFSEAARAMFAANNARSLLTVPMIRQDRVVGAFSLFNQDENGFSDTRIALVQTFADQAVIAIENVRLFAELEATNRGLTTALDQQTATSEILRAISSSLTDVQPVFDTIVQSGLRLLGGYSATMMLLRDDDRLDLVANTSTSAEADSSLVDAFPMPLRRIPPGERAIHERRAHAVQDVESAADVTDVMRETGRARGWRSNLFVPMIRDDVALGLISITRREPGPFAADQIALLEIFAAQAVIAIENVRLFKELETRNRDLTEALDRQTATAEILRVISQAQTELQPVFEAIVDHAMRLFRALAASVLQIDGELVRLTAMRGGLPGSEQQLREQSPWPIDTPSPVGFCIAERTIVHIPDIEADRTVDEGIRALGRTRGWRSILAAPIMRDGQPIGAITIQRAEAGAFSPAEIELLKTFADQAVIAIENTRLLGELRARTGQLTRSVEELTALGDVSRALSSTLDLDRVLQTIVTRASQLSGTDACSVFEYDEATEAFHLRATNNLDEEVVTLARQTPTRKGEGVQGRMAVTRQPVQVPDIAQEDAYHGPLRDILLRTGTRAVLAIPMLRENELIGGLTVNKKTPGAFSLEVIELLTTFATQSALAIQNARLFQEIANKSRQLEAASQHKSEFLANMSHELRTPLNAIIGFSEVLGERLFGELNEKQDEYLKDIHASGQHLLSLINDILDLSKIEAGRMELELTDFHLPAALDNALVLVRERAGRRGITLHMTTDERLEYVRADERKIKQVLLNLLSNAIKFTPEGGQIEVQAKPVDGSVEVSVSDTGVGIAPEDQEAIFEEFRQVGTADKKVEGTGLGLALSRRFIELHGGRIWVESQVGVGSRFTFTIPVSPDDAPARG